MARLPDVYVPDRLAAAVQQLCADRRISYAELVRQALRRELLEAVDDTGLRELLRQVLARLDEQAPAPAEGALDRARSALSALGEEPGECDECGGPAAAARTTFDLSTPGQPMTISRLCAAHLQVPPL